MEQLKRIAVEVAGKCFSGVFINVVVKIQRISRFIDKPAGSATLQGTQVSIDFSLPSSKCIRFRRKLILSYIFIFITQCAIVVDNILANKTYKFTKTRIVCPKFVFPLLFADQNLQDQKYQVDLGLKECFAGC